MKSIESPKELDNVQYYFLGSKKINNNLDQEIKEFLIEDDVHIRNYGSLSSINIDSINKSVILF